MLLSCIGSLTYCDQPCTIRDFMNYLIYIEMSAENLQFFLWHRDYVQRFNSATTSDIALAPEWTQDEQNETFNKLQKEHRDGLKRDTVATAGIFKGTDFEKSGPVSPATMDKAVPIFSSNNPFNTPPRTPNGDALSEFAGQNSMTYRNQAQEAFASAGTRAPCKLTANTCYQKLQAYISIKTEWY